MPGSLLYMCGTSVLRAREGVEESATVRILFAPCRRPHPKSWWSSANWSGFDCLISWPARTPMLTVEIYANSFLAEELA